MNKIPSKKLIFISRDNWLRSKQLNRNRMNTYIPTLFLDSLNSLNL